MKRSKHDGQAYIYNGGGGICKGGKLKDNMMELDGPMHNSALSHHDWLRSVCVDKLYYNADGTIQKVFQTGRETTPTENLP